MSGFIKQCIVLLILLHSGLSLSAEIALSLYSEQDFNGELIHIYEGDRIDERHIARSNYPQLSGKDFFSPVGRNKASSLIVEDGYCVILASNEFFGGTWGVYGPGNYPNLEGLNNTVESALSYKKYNNSCKPEIDIPILYQNENYTGSKFPIQGNEHLPLSSQNEPYRFSWKSGTITRTSVLYSHKGGFSFKASSFTVPGCYEVGLTGEKAVQPYPNTTYASHTFGAGQYPQLRPYGLENMSQDSWINLDENCISIIPSGSDVDTHNPSLGNGIVRIQSFFKNQLYLDIKPGKIHARSVETDSLSAVWQLEEAGGGYVRIRNLWKPTQYLNIEYGTLESSWVSKYWASAQWKLVRDESWEGSQFANGDKVYRIQNRWKPEQYLHIESGRIESGEISEGWFSARWNIHDL